MAKEDDILSALVAGGAMISDEANHIGSLPIHAELLGPPTARQLYFVQAGAEDQHHTHAIGYDAAEVLYGRDLSLSQDGKLAAYVAPIAEWPCIDQAAAREALALARNYLAATPGAAEAFTDLIAVCRPTPEKALA